MVDAFSEFISMASKSYIPTLIDLTIDNLATPPLESPIGFHQLQAYPGNAQSERHPSFPPPMPTPTEYYPFPRQLTSPTINTFQAYANNTSQVVYSRSSDENSQSSTPTLQSPPLANAPRPTKIGSVSADIPTGRNRRQSLASEASAETVTPATRRRASLSATQHHLSRSPNRSHQRRSSAMPNVPLSLARPISEDDETKTVRMQVKRSKSANTLLVKHDPEFKAHDQFVPDKSAVVENESSGDDGGIIKPDELAKTKAARAQSEHRRRVELKESFERLRLTLGVPQPRAGKRDLVEQAIIALEYYKRKETEMLAEIQYLQQGVAPKYSPQQYWH